MIRRRTALLALPAGLAACATPVPMVEGPPIGYRHLTPLRLDVATLTIDEETPIAGPNDLGRTLQPSAAEAVRTMGRDRLFAFGTENTARFVVVRAQVLREAGPPAAGLFATQGERLDCQLTCRLEIRNPTGLRLGFAEATAARTRTVESDPALRMAVAETLLRQAMFDLNTEFEFQLRRALRAYLVEGDRAAPPLPVQREELPRT
jgi:hypothetical protein